MLSFFGWKIERQKVIDLLNTLKDGRRIVSRLIYAFNYFDLK